MLSRLIQNLLKQRAHTACSFVFESFLWFVYYRGLNLGPYDCTLHRITELVIPALEIARGGFLGIELFL